MTITSSCHLLRVERSDSAPTAQRLANILVIFGLHSVLARVVGLICQ